MPIRNPHWYNLNETRDYPVDDSASCLSDSGERLPQDIISDLRLRYPDILGLQPYIAAVTVSRLAVTVLIQAADSPENHDMTFAPVASITMLKADIVRGRQYPLEARYPGVFGYITFGSGIGGTYAGKFTSPNQSRITQRAYDRYTGLPISSMGKLYEATALTGVVLLRAEPPVEITSGLRDIDGVSQEAIIIRLRDDSATADESVFKRYAGPCAKRPESNTCGDPQPVEFINGVGPDCDGTIELVFQGCAIVGQNTEDCSVVIDCGFGLTESCRPPFVPDEDGKLPSEYDPIVTPVTPPEPPEPNPGDSISDSMIVLGELPYTDCFSLGTAQDFVVQTGQFIFVADDSPWDPCQLPYLNSQSSPEPLFCYASEGPQSAGTRNVVIWDGFDVTTFYRQVTTDVKLMYGPTGARHNGGVVINYRPHTSYPDRRVYYLAEIDYDSQSFRIRRFNGSTYQTAVDVVVPGIQLDAWYRITVQVQPYPLAPQTVAITARLSFLEDEPMTVVLGPLLVNNYTPDDGKWGFSSDHALARFAYFDISEWPGISY